MITIMWYELVGWSLIMILCGIALWDMIWTVMVPDKKASAHFAKNSWKHNFSWISVIALSVIAIIGWLY